MNTISNTKLTPNDLNIFFLEFFSKYGFRSTAAGKKTIKNRITVVSLIPQYNELEIFEIKNTELRSIIMIKLYRNSHN